MKSKPINKSHYAELVIPLKSYLVKFIAKNHPIEPFFVKSKNCHFSAIILDQVKRSYYKNLLKYEDGKYIQFRCMLPLSENRFTIDNETVLRINQNLRLMFDQQLIDFISIFIEKKGDIKLACESFMEFYDIQDDDLTFDAMVKMYYRARYPREVADVKHKETMNEYQLKLFEK